jgi:hypothetical protein
VEEVQNLDQIERKGSCSRKVCEIMCDAFQTKSVYSTIPVKTIGPVYLVAVLFKILFLFVEIMKLLTLRKSKTEHKTNLINVQDL